MEYIQMREHQSHIHIVLGVMMTYTWAYYNVKHSEPDRPNTTFISPPHPITGHRHEAHIEVQVSFPYTRTSRACSLVPRDRRDISNTNIVMVPVRVYSNSPTKWDLKHENPWRVTEICRNALPRQRLYRFILCWITAYDFTSLQGKKKC